jgi:hypothetical protein
MPFAGKFAVPKAQASGCRPGLGSSPGPDSRCSHAFTQKAERCLGLLLMALLRNIHRLGNPIWEIAPRVAARARCGVLSAPISSRQHHLPRACRFTPVFRRPPSLHITGLVVISPISTTSREVYKSDGRAGSNTAQASAGSEVISLTVVQIGDIIFEWDAERWSHATIVTRSWRGEAMHTHAVKRDQWQRVWETTLTPDPNRRVVHRKKRSLAANGGNVGSPVVKVCDSILAVAKGPRRKDGRAVAGGRDCRATLEAVR